MFFHSALLSSQFTPWKIHLCKPSLITGRELVINSDSVLADILLLSAGYHWTIWAHLATALPSCMLESENMDKSYSFVHFVHNLHFTFGSNPMNASLWWYPKAHNVVTSWHLCCLTSVFTAWHADWRACKELLVWFVLRCIYAIEISPTIGVLVRLKKTVYPDCSRMSLHAFHKSSLSQTNTVSLFLAACKHIDLFFF